MRIKRINYRCDSRGCTAQSEIHESGSKAISEAKHAGWSIGLKHLCPDHNGRAKYLEGNK